MTPDAPTPTATPRPRWTWAALVALYLLAFPYHPGLRSPNELSRLWQARALVDHGTFRLDEVIATDGPVGDLATFDGHLYPSKAPLLSLLAAPIYALLEALTGPVSESLQVYASRLLLTVLPTLLLLVALRRALRALVSPAIADGVVLTYGAGSLALSYSLLFMSHQPVAVLLSFAFLALLRVHLGRWTWGGQLLAGLLGGLALATEYTSVLGLAGLATFGAWSAWSNGGASRIQAVLKAFSFACAGALLPVAGLLAYHQACFGHPFHTGYRTLADTGYQAWHEGGLFGVGLPDAGAAFLSFFSPLRGLFVLAPFLLLAPLGLLQLRQRARTVPLLVIPSAVLLVIAGAYTYFTSAFSYESWGWTTGPRHLTAWVPFLLPGVAVMLDDLAKRTDDDGRFRFAVGAGLCAASVVVTGVVSLVNYVPDVVSSPLFGLAVPLLRAGDWPPSLLSLLGLPQPWAALPLLVLVVGVAFDVLELLVRASSAESESARRTQWQRGLATIVVVLVVHFSLARDTDDDARALSHLHTEWSTSVGR